MPYTVYIFYFVSKCWSAIGGGEIIFLHLFYSLVTARLSNTHLKQKQNISDWIFRRNDSWEKVPTYQYHHSTTIGIIIMLTRTSNDALTPEYSAHCLPNAKCRPIGCCPRKPRCMASYYYHDYCFRFHASRNILHRYSSRNVRVRHISAVGIFHHIVELRFDIYIKARHQIKYSQMQW